ncbi:MAG: hypothetical protein M3Z75_30145, partial [Actinomycetota bacterium]|nr:hypothetical protein [Actinomycetota bacterium]
MGTGQAFLLLETTATIFVTGVLWTMQLLNYPLLALVGTDAFPRYEAAHNRRFALVVVLGVLAATAGGFDQRTLSLLVRSNWIRVAAWSAAAVIAVWMCQQVFVS